MWKESKTPESYRNKLTKAHRAFRKECPYFLKEMMNPFTLVLGASSKPGRVSGEAMFRLKQAGVPVIAVGRTGGSVAEIPISPEIPEELPGPVDTVTLYLAPENQPPYYDQILRIKPDRVIFNPGTENSAFAQQLKSEGIEPIFGCTLVMLASGVYHEEGLKTRR